MEQRNPEVSAIVLPSFACLQITRCLLTGWKSWQPIVLLRRGRFSQKFGVSLIRLGSLTVRIYGERGASMEQRNFEVSAIALPSFACLQITRCLLTGWKSWQPIVLLRRGRFSQKFGVSLIRLGSLTVRIDGREKPLWSSNSKVSAIAPASFACLQIA